MEPTWFVKRKWQQPKAYAALSLALLIDLIIALSRAEAISILGDILRNVNHQTPGALPYAETDAMQLPIMDSSRHPVISSLTATL